MYGSKHATLRVEPVKLSRREMLVLLAGGVPALRQAATKARIATGRFEATRASLAAYEVPAWFRDAKFGIWAHWGPQSAPEFGDWYARNMYIEGHEQYRYHLERYGHPSTFGFRDVIATWKAEAFEPRRLMRRYRKAGAKYFVTMGAHHDNFDLWNSKHTRWNAVKTGPRKDIVGLFRKAAREEGLKFGVSDHLWISPKWFSVSRGADKDGPRAGVRYDGADDRYADLYGDCPDVYTDLPWDESGIAEPWKRHWLLRAMDLVDQHRPDLYYVDGGIPFEGHGLALVAHLYNQSARAHGGRVEAVFTSKRREDCERGTCVFDVERGVVESIWPRPCQSHTCVGNWHYKRGIQYKSVKAVVDMLVDVVSRNGNLLLNFPLRTDGSLDAQEEKILTEVGTWLAVNGEAIYGTRPWRTFGESPATEAGAGAAEAKFNESLRKDLTARDVRYTTKDASLFALCMGWPAGEAVFPALAAGGAHGVGKVQRVTMLGSPDPLRFRQEGGGLRVALPARPPTDHAVAFKVTFA